MPTHTFLSTNPPDRIIVERVTRAGNTLRVVYVERTVPAGVEAEESVYVDLDADGQPIGVEFLNAGDFLAFLERRGGVFAVSDAEPDGATVAAD